MGGLYLSFEKLKEDEIKNIPSSDTNKQNFIIILLIFLLSLLGDFFISGVVEYISKVWRII